MSLLGGTAFAAEDDLRNGLIIVSGTTQYHTTNLPANSEASTALQFTACDFRKPFYNGEKSTTPREPSGENYWMHFRYRTVTSSGSNDQVYLGGGRDGTQVIGISFEDNTLKPTIRVAGTVRATSVSVAASTSTWERFHIHVEGHGLGDTISVYKDGALGAAPFLTYDLIAADVTALLGTDTPNELLIEGRPAVDDRVTDIFAVDPDDGVGGAINTPANFAEASFQRRVFNADGASADFTGTYADIDEIPASDADGLEAVAVDDLSTFTKAAVGGAIETVLYVQSLWRLTRSGTDQGENAQIYIDNGTGKAETATTWPGDGDIIQQHHTDDASAQWTVANYDATEFGIYART